MAVYPSCPIYRIPDKLSLFGQRLVDTGWLEFEQMLQVERESRQSNESVITSVERLIGRPLSADVKQMYKQLSLFELKLLHCVEPFVFENSGITINQVSELIDTLIPIDICRRYRLVPLFKIEHGPTSLLVAMVNPNDLAAQDDLNRILRPQGLLLKRLVIPVEDYQQIISQYLDNQFDQQKQLDLQSKFDSKADLDELEYLGLEEIIDDANVDLKIALTDGEAEPVVALVNKILVQALQEEVSNIHVEPQKEYLRIRFRKYGVLRDAVDPLPKKIIPAVTARLKVIADLDILEKCSPQTGKIYRIFDGRKIEFDVSTLPSRCGEGIVLTLVNRSLPPVSLENIFPHSSSRQSVQEMIAHSHGLLLVVGVPGSSKITTLYSLLAQRNTVDSRIITFEEVVQYFLEGITQVQLPIENRKDYINACLRQDPDIVLIDELCDRQTTEIAINAARSKCLVLSTINASNPVMAVQQLLDMGIEPYRFNRSLIGVIGQHLLRKLCEECRIAYTPLSEERVRFGISETNPEETFYRANSLHPQEIKTTKAEGTLCQNCCRVGYKGQIAVHEILRMSPVLQQLLIQKPSVEAFHATAQAEGMQTYLDNGFELARQGLTSLDELEQLLKHQY
ncbi:type II/IV secretion system protein [Oscillatoria sp. FACHB-1407]|uniref:GspE/PulE family protein n=1 Tax=Oscillatoria sp. FACHB-1407 TaxID=2692847 RepID=UPI00168768C4|nr:GspE/PulE family protein [Oscillatoria sp. FACHB-1407]MBD2464580.1 type II/IV secretion system protein [Oscillatoria sp. FACHB-1407]